MNTRKKLFLNTFSSLVFQLVTIICGFILPRLILVQYGSAVNGLINSITQFLQIIAFLELGVGAVVQSSLYKPLAEHNHQQYSKVIVSASRFFRKIAFILLIYIIILMGFYPFIVQQSFDWLYTAILIAAMSISSFSQYYFGVVDRLLLTADQRGYIQYSAQTITLIMNTAACVLLIKVGASIQIVKLTTSLIFLLRPIFLRLYVNRNYNLDRKIKYEIEPIQQKWNGISQHIAAVILGGTDIVVLTLFATLSDVSVYSVYYLIVYGVTQLLLSMTNGFQSLLGELWAKQNKELLMRFFSWMEWLIHTGVLFVFGCTAVLILPFISVYTNGITDANYIVPLFSILIVLANGWHCLRLPYSIAILAAGHYKQTQNCYIIAAILNVSISVVAVHFFGLVGVAIGTLVALIFQTVWLAVYNSRNIIKWRMKKSVKQFLVDAITAGLIFPATMWITMSSVSYLSWFIMALKVAGIILTVIILVNLIFYFDKIKIIFRKISKKLKRDVHE